MSGGWIGVDLDGTLAHYDHWRGEDRIGDPIGPMVERVKGWLKLGVQVRIFTARVADGDPAHYDVIQAWCLEHIGQRLDITNQKDFGMVELWDDRCVQVAENTGEPVLEGSSRLKLLQMP